MARKNPPADVTICKYQESNYVIPTDSTKSINYAVGFLQPFEPMNSGLIFVVHFYIQLRSISCLASLTKSH